MHEVSSGDDEDIKTRDRFLLSVSLVSEYPCDAKVKARLTSKIKCMFGLWGCCRVQNWLAFCPFFDLEMSVERKDVICLYVNLTVDSLSKHVL